MINGRELAMAVLNLRGRPAEAIATAAAGTGFDSFTLRLIEPKTGDHAHLVTDVGARAALRRLMTDLGVGLLDVEVVRLRAATAVADLLPALDAAADLGARHVLTVCDDPDDQRFLANYTALSQECAQRGMRAVLEFMRFSECKSFEHAMRLVLLARLDGADGAGVLVDALHLERSGGSADQIALYAEDFPEMFPYVQICDGPLLPPHGGVAQIRDEAVTGRLLPGDGELPLHRLLAALPPGIPVCVETPVRSLAGHSDADRAQAAFEAATRLLQGATPLPS